MVETATLSNNLSIMLKEFDITSLLVVLHKTVSSVVVLLSSIKETYPLWTNMHSNYYTLGILDKIEHCFGKNLFQFFCFFIFLLSSSFTILLAFSSFLLFSAKKWRTSSCFVIVTRFNSNKSTFLLHNGWHNTLWIFYARLYILSNGELL